VLFDIVNKEKTQQKFCRDIRNLIVLKTVACCATLTKMSRRCCVYVAFKSRLCRVYVA